MLLRRKQQLLLGLHVWDIRMGRHLVGNTEKRTARNSHVHLSSDIDHLLGNYNHPHCWFRPSTTHISLFIQHNMRFGIAISCKNHAFRSRGCPFLCCTNRFRNQADIDSYGILIIVAYAIVACVGWITIVHGYVFWHYPLSIHFFNNGNTTLILDSCADE